jgi:hypothetical protein
MISEVRYAVVGSSSMNGGSRESDADSEYAILLDLIHGQVATT